MKSRNFNFIISIVGFVALCVAAFFLNRNEGEGITWFWGAMVLFAAWPIESAIFTFTRPSFIQHLVASIALAGMLLLSNFLQVHAFTWSLLLAPACMLWPLAYLIWMLVMKWTKSNILGATVGWILVSGISIAAEYLITKKLSWSLPLTIFLAFWPAASLVFTPEPKEKKSSVTEEKPVE